MDDAALEDLFATLGSISIRRMFGGKGLYHDGRIFAVVVSGELRLKTDAETAATFEAAGAERWVYQREGRSPVAMPYHSVPDEAYEDPEAMAEWARLAIGAAERAASAKTAPGRRHRPVKPTT